MKISPQKIERKASPANGSIRWILLTEIAFKNLFYKKLRTALTVMAVVIGVGAVVFLLAFGFGLRNVVTNQVVDSNSIRSIDVESAKSQLVTLNSDTITKVENIAHVTDVARMFSVAGTTHFNNSNTESVLYSVDQSYLDLTSLKIVAGNAPKFTADDQIIVNASYAKAVGQSEIKDIIGKELDITFAKPSNTNAQNDKKSNDQKLAFKGRVIGVVDTGSGAEMYIPSKIFDQYGFEEANQLKVLVDDKSNVSEVQSKIETFGLVTNSPINTLEQINQVFVFLNMIFLAFGGIGLIIAVLGMFNTLTISLLERTREIGLMITLGARRKDIRRLFMVEAVGLSMIGGILGMFGAFIFSIVIDIILNGFARGRGVAESFSVFSFQPMLLSSVLLFSAALGFLVVYLPAKRAADTNPIEALKS